VYPPMGEDAFPYGAGQVPAYPSAFHIKIGTDSVPTMMAFHLPNSDPFCADPKIIASVDAYPDDPMETYVNTTPQLQHVSSLSTTSTTESFHSSLPSADSAEMSAFEMHYTEPQEFDWSMNGTPAFQWPPNRTLPQKFG
jgi:hypothetical protein